MDCSFEVVVASVHFVFEFVFVFVYVFVFVFAFALAFVCKFPCLASRVHDRFDFMLFKIPCERKRVIKFSIYVEKIGK